MLSLAVMQNTFAQLCVVGGMHGVCSCRYCGSGQDLTVDHIKPVCKGGTWEWSNLVTACNKCNGKKGSKTLKQLGWKLKKIPSVCSPPAFVISRHAFTNLLLQDADCCMTCNGQPKHATSVPAGTISMAGWCTSWHEPRCAQFTQGAVSNTGSLHKRYRASTVHGCFQTCGIICNC